MFLILNLETYLNQLNFRFEYYYHLFIFIYSPLLLLSEVFFYFFDSADCEGMGLLLKSFILNNLVFILFTVRISNI